MFPLDKTNSLVDKKNGNCQNSTISTYTYLFQDARGIPGFPFISNRSTFSANEHCSSCCSNHCSIICTKRDRWDVKREFPLCQMLHSSEVRSLYLPRHRPQRLLASHHILLLLSMFSLLALRRHFAGSLLQHAQDRQSRPFAPNYVCN